MENQRLPSGISVEKIRFYPSIKEALFAVNNGEADFIMVCPLGWNRISCAIILRILLP